MVNGIPYPKGNFCGMSASAPPSPKRPPMAYGAYANGRSDNINH